MRTRNLFGGRSTLRGAVVGFAVFALLVSCARPVRAQSPGAALFTSHNISAMTDGLPSSSDLNSGVSERSTEAAPSISRAALAIAQSSAPGETFRPRAPMLTAPEAVKFSPLGISEISSLASISRWGQSSQSPDTQQSSTKTSTKPKHHGAFLTMAILGTAGVAGGITTLALAHSSHCSSPTAPGACNDLDTTGKVLIPVGAVMAGLGYFFAFHHSH